MSNIEWQRPSLLDDLADALRAQHPLVFLDAASSIAQATAADRFAGTPLAKTSPTPTREALIESFLDVGEHETDALLLVWAEMLNEPRLRQAISTSGQRHSLPRWVRSLDEVRPTRAVENTHILGDGDNLFLGVETSGRSFTIVAYIDHNMGTIVKDCFVIDVPIREAIGRLEELRDDDTEMHELLLEDAAAKLSDAIVNGDRMIDPFETDSWPGCRPLIEWMLRLMPSGGVGYEFQELSDAEWDALVDEFEESPFRAAVGADGVDQARTLMEFAANYGTGDPLRWSSVVVEIMLLDLVPRKVIADMQYLREIPDAVRAVIRFAHDRRSIPAALTEDALAAVDQFEPEYLSTLSEPRSPGAAAILEKLGLIDEDPFGVNLARYVGGQETLESLDDEPLPDEMLDIAVVPGDIADRVRDIASLTDAATMELFDDVELRTASRRALARVAASDPAIFRRRSSNVTAAAALMWIVAKGNGYLVFGDDVMVQDLMEHFELKGSPGQRAQPMLRALGLEEFGWADDPRLGSADLLISPERAEIIRVRDSLNDFD